MAQAKPDGYTLLYTINGPLVTAPTLYKKTLGYDPLRDLAPVSLVGTSPNVLVVPSSLQVDNVKDFVKLVKSRGNSLNYGSVGPGSSAHLAMEMFKERAGVDLAHIPYSGFPQVITAIIGGDVQAGFMVPAIAVPQTRDNKVRLLAVTSLEPSAAPAGHSDHGRAGLPGFRGDLVERGAGARRHAHARDRAAELRAGPHHRQPGGAQADGTAILHARAVHAGSADQPNQE